MTSHMCSWIMGMLSSPLLVTTACLAEVPHAPDYLADEPECGNGVIDPDEECDPGGEEPTCLDAGHVSGYSSCRSDCTQDVSSCRSHPGAGQVVITEIMKQPLPNEAGLEAEWFEIFNPTGETFELSGCTVQGSPGEPGFLVDPSSYGVLLGPLQYRIFSSNTSDSLSAIGYWAMGDFELSNDAQDVVRLECGGVVVDEVIYYDSTFPDAIGRSMSLDAGTYDASANGTATYWCACIGPHDDDYDYGQYSGDPYAFGTPNAPNPECPAVAAASGSALYFSEYMNDEGIAYDALEIHYPLGSPLDLGACEVRIHPAGSIEPGSIIGLAGLVPSGSETVLCNDGFAVLDRCDLLSDALVLDGNETLVLACGGSTLDVFGQIGVYPGAEWKIDDVGISQVTLRRSCETVLGDVDGTDPFDPSLEWIAAPAGDVTDLERYQCP